MQDASGFTSLKKINEMSKIEIEYVQRRENNFEVDITEDIVILPGQTFSNSAEEPAKAIPVDTRNVPRMGLFGGRFQIRR